MAKVIGLLPAVLQNSLRNPRPSATYVGLYDQFDNAIKNSMVDFIDEFYSWGHSNQPTWEEYCKRSEKEKAAMFVKYKMAVETHGEAYWGWPTPVGQSVWEL